LDEARRLVAARGLDAVTMDELAAAAGVGKGTVFRAFGDKAGLAWALLDDLERELQRAILDGPPPLGHGAPPADRARAFVDAYLDLLESGVDLLVVAEAGRPGARFETGAYAFWSAHLTALLREVASPPPPMPPPPPDSVAAPARPSRARTSPETPASAPDPGPSGTRRRADGAVPARASSGEADGVVSVAAAAQRPGAATADVDAAAHAVLAVLAADLYRHLRHILGYPRPRIGALARTVTDGLLTSLGAPPPTA
jgi:AcrR family transcriptional regulator